MVLRADVPFFGLELGVNADVNQVGARFRGSFRDDGEFGAGDLFERFGKPGGGGLLLGGRLRGSEDAVGCPGMFRQEEVGWILSGCRVRTCQEEEQKENVKLHGGFLEE